MPGVRRQRYNIVSISIVSIAMPGVRRQRYNALPTHIANPSPSPHSDPNSDPKPKPIPNPIPNPDSDPELDPSPGPSPTPTPNQASGLQAQVDLLKASSARADQVVSIAIVGSHSKYSHSK